MGESVGISKGLAAIGIIVALGIGIGSGWAIGSIMSPAGQFATTVDIEGSNTLFELQQTWAAEYMSLNPGITINVGGAGSAVGYTQLINGLVDIGDASREPKSSEIDAANASGVNLILWPVAIDGIVIVVHPSNDIFNISWSLLRGIYNGTITAWSDVNATCTRAGHAITAYSRNPASGTFLYFQENVMEDDDYSSSVNQLAGNSDIISAVAADQDGIGYVGASYAQTPSVNVLWVNDPDTGTLVEPTFANIKSFTYSIARYLYMVTNGNPTGYEMAYLSWCMSVAGQALANTTGYVPAYEKSGP